jgi:hypothetical protein
MATNFPGAADNNTTLPNPGATDKQNSPDHASQHANANDAIKAVEAKVGTGASTPVVSTLLFGTGTGTSAWTQLTSSQLAASLSDETGTGANVFANTPTLITPKVDTINESTPANGVTIDGLNIKDNALTTANSVSNTNISGVSTIKLANPYKFSVYRNVLANSGNGVFAVVAFDTKEFDTGSNVTSGVFTVPVTGFYQFNWAVEYAGSANDCVTALFRNGTELKRGSGRTSDNSTKSSGGSCLVSLTAADTIDIRAYATVTTVLNNGVSVTHFSGFVVSTT